VMTEVTGIALNEDIDLQLEFDTNPDKF